MCPPGRYAAVYVELLDRNDNKPRFTQDEYISAVWEGNSKGTFVVQVGPQRGCSHFRSISR